MALLTAACSRSTAAVTGMMRASQWLLSSARKDLSFTRSRGGHCRTEAFQRPKHEVWDAAREPTDALQRDRLVANR